MRETDALLQTILYQLEKAKTVEEARRAVRVMCNKENIDAVKAQLADEAKDNKRAPE